MSNTVHITSPFWNFQHLREEKAVWKEIHNFYLEIRLAHEFIGEKMRFAREECLGNGLVIYTLNQCHIFHLTSEKRGNVYLAFSFRLLYLFFQTQ
jgi:hypothetical protein